MRSIMRYVPPAVLLAALSGCGLQSDADVYNVGASQAYHLLVDPAKATRAYGTSASGVLAINQSRIVWWQATYDHIECVIDLSSPTADTTKVAVNCGPGADQGTRGPIAPMTLAEARDSTIEMIDATLTGRAFDHGREDQTASHWPKNVKPEPIAGIDFGDSNKVSSPDSPSEFTDDAELGPPDSDADGGDPSPAD